jgi:hypothetical protein
MESGLSKTPKRDLANWCDERAERVRSTLPFMGAMK